MLRPRPAPRKLAFESLESRQLLAAVVTPAEAKQLLDRAVVANQRNDAIIAIVDRSGNILGVRVESGVNPAVLSNPATLDFAIDGAIAEARTAAFFSNNSGPGTALTSRTIRQISQTTITQREVQANPNSSDPTIVGPGYVAPIGLGGHFPPGIAHTPPVDLFAIEHTNRAVFSGVDAMGHNIAYNIPFAAVGVGKTIPIPFSYEQQTAAPGSPIVDNNRGIGTMPGGIPLYKKDPSVNNRSVLVGGIGVFFPGPNGYSDFEQGFNPSNPNQSAKQRENSTLALQAEWMAFAATGGSGGVGARVGTIAGVPPVAGYDLPLAPNVKIFLAGISLDQVGQGSKGGVTQTLSVGRNIKRSSAVDLGIEEPINSTGDKYQTGVTPDDGWLVPARDGVSMTAAQVTQIINQGITTANQTRAQIRVPAGTATRMVFSVVDTNGDVLGLYRMRDATIFSIDVAVAKARNVTYYASASIQPFDRVNVNDLNPSSPFLPVGTAFTNRTFRFLAEPRYPAGVDGSVPGAFSILRESWVNPRTAYNIGPPVDITDPMNDTRVLTYDSFNPGTNFHDPNNLANQNGVIFFPGSSPLYVSQALVGGFGVSGDGVDQDDVVTFFGAHGFAAPSGIRADHYFVRGVRLPYQKFSRNAFQL